jgi:hypothetical protein
MRSLLPRFSFRVPLEYLTNPNFLLQSNGFHSHRSSQGWFSRANLLRAAML